MRNPIFRDNPPQSRFELPIHDAMVTATYRRGPNRLIIERVEADPSLRRTGATDRFMEALVKHARDHRLSIEAACPFAAGWLQARPEHADLLVDTLPPQDATDGASAFHDSVSRLGPNA